MKTLLIAAALVAASCATAEAQQRLVPTARGPHYVPSYGYRGPPPSGYGYGHFNYAPRGYVPPGFLGGYLPPVGPRYYERRGDVGGAIAGALLGAAATILPQVIAQPMPPPRPVAAPMPEPEGDAMDALPDASPNTARITRAEIEAALADWCSTNGTAPLCQKMQGQPQR